MNNVSLFVEVSAAQHRIAQCIHTHTYNIKKFIIIIAILIKNIKEESGFALVAFLTALSAFCLN